MSTDVLSSLNNFPGSDAVQLQKNRCYAGILRGVRQDGDVFLADFTKPVEISEAVAAELQCLVGERVIIANVAGQIRAGRRST